MAIQSMPKNSEPLIYGTSWRLTSPEAALEIAQKARSFAGVSRVAKINPLADLSVPVFSVSRPESTVSVTVCSGKGTTELESRLSGLYEAIEIACAEKSIPSVRASFEELKTTQNNIVSLEQFGIVPNNEPIEWTEVTQYESGEPYWVPSVSVGLLPTSKPFLPDSNGLASGTTFEEAIFHGLLEVLERHAYSLALVFRGGISVDLDSIDDSFLELAVQELTTKGLTLEVKDISEWTGIPTYYCLIFSKQEQDSHLISGGLGTHLDALIALKRAVTEAFQSRAIAIAGAREDMSDKMRVQGHRVVSKYHLYRFWLEPTPHLVPFPKPIAPIPLEQAIQQVLDQAKAHDPSLGKLFFYRFPSPEGVVVTRVILEGSESFASNRHRMGTRIRKLYKDMEAKYATHMC